MTTRDERIAKVREWLFRSGAIGNASAAQLDPRQKLQGRVALTAMAAADQALSSPPDDAPGTSAAAISLYREAAYWALSARSREEPEGKPGLADLFAALPGAEALTLAGGDAELALVKDVLVGQTFVETASLDDLQAHAAALAAQGFVRALVTSAHAPDKRLEKVQSQRWARPVLSALLLLVVVYGLVATWRYIRRPHDWAAGKRWRASSAYEGYPPTGKVGTIIKFGLMVHTDNNPSPWVEIDLGTPTLVRSVEIWNHPDCCQDRAVPLVVELSDNAQDWAEVARRASTFNDWTASFAQRRTRYVRLRVEKPSWLHLANVSVY